MLSQGVYYFVYIKNMQQATLVSRILNFKLAQHLRVQPVHLQIHFGCIPPLLYLYKRFLLVNNLVSVPETTAVTMSLAVPRTYLKSQLTTSSSRKRMQHPFSALTLWCLLPTSTSFFIFSQSIFLQFHFCMGTSTFMENLNDSLRTKPGQHFEFFLPQRSSKSPYRFTYGLVFFLS